MVNLEPMCVRLFLSSGDLLADRRFEFARDLLLKGDLACCRRSVVAGASNWCPTLPRPGLRSAKFTKGSASAMQAIAAFRRARAADPDDRHGASLHLMRHGAEQLSAMPPAYVQTLFDQYAPRFDAALINDLGYRAPALLFKAVLSVRASARKPAFFKRAIDLGCGTGLAAMAFARDVDRFIGVDLSPRMIEWARSTGLYAELEVADMLQSLRGKPDASADLILAADAMVYVSDLAPLLREAARVLTPGGLFAFTVETHDGTGGEGVLIGDGLRYTHSASYVRAEVAAARLITVAVRATVDP